ncbi:MAG TPA: hypothetical protein VM884_10045 [Flavisolibacter sp.]|jgi:hypothetical protein|nr:hypothetical protein [Flavisolibacter sp.]
MKPLLFVLTACILFFACQREIDFGNGTNTGSIVKCTGCSYLPVCDSTKLQYIDSTASGTDTLSATLAILGDTAINGRKFTRVTPFAAFSLGLLYNCDGGDYRIYQDVPHLGIDIDSLVQSLGLPFPIGAITIPSKIETTILKANAAAGATWSDTVFKFSPLPIFTVVAKLDYKIEEKGIQRTVLGKRYNNIIHVSSKLNVAVPLLPVPVNFSVDYYFADGIGIIETKTANNGVVQTQSKLYQYKIK